MHSERNWEMPHRYGMWRCFPCRWIRGRRPTLKGVPLPLPVWPGFHSESSWSRWMKRETSKVHAPVAVLLLYALGFPAVICYVGAAWNYRNQRYQQYHAEEQRYRTAAASYLAVNDEARLIR